MSKILIINNNLVASKEKMNANDKPLPIATSWVTKSKDLAKNLLNQMKCTWLAVVFIMTWHFVVDMYCKHAEFQSCTQLVADSSLNYLYVPITQVHHNLQLSKDLIYILFSKLLILYYIMSNCLKGVWELVLKDAYLIFPIEVRPSTYRFALSQIMKPRIH